MVVKLFKNLFGKGKKNTKSKKSVRRETTKKNSGSKKETKKKTIKKKTIAKKRTKKKPDKKVKTKKIKIKEVGVVTHYFGKISVGIIKLKTKLDLRDRIEIKGAHADFNQPVKSMQINHKNVTSARKGAEVGIKVKKRVHLNDKVYKKTS